MRFDLGFDFIDPSRSSHLMASAIPVNQHPIKIPIYTAKINNFIMRKHVN